MTFPEQLVDEAHRLSERARRALAEVVEVADTFDRVVWEDTDLPDDVEGSDGEARFLEAIQPAYAALAAIGLKATDAQGCLPRPEQFEEMFPEMPEYRRLFDQEVDRWLSGEGGR